jgi:vacuolar-type H+-ATPase subunit I/STV1
MPIAEMRRVTVIGHLSQREKILRTLQQLGQFEAINLRDTVTPEEWAALFQPETTSKPAAGVQIKGSDDRLAELKYSIDLVQRFNKEKKSILDQLAGTRVTLTQAEYDEIIQAPDLGGEIYRKGRAID